MKFDFLSIPQSSDSKLEFSGLGNVSYQPQGEVSTGIFTGPPSTFNQGSS